jgi:hypothetical protein
MENSDIIYSENRANSTPAMSNFDVRECSANIQRLPDNHKALLATFPPSEQMKVIELLKLHQDYISADLLLAMDTNNFDKIQQKPQPRLTKILSILWRGPV